VNDNTLSNTPSEHSRVPDTSMLPGGDKAGPAAVGLLHQAAQGAHSTIDRLAVGAEPTVRKMGESVTAVNETLHATTAQLRETRDEWAESARSSIRSNPLTCLATAFALGALVARLTR